jgi:glycosyltransferase domain-containing protein
LSKDLTIVIPTYERPKYLERSINFWKNYDFKILYLDGSINAQNDLDLPNNIRYIHSNTSILQRLIMSTKEVKTPYVCFLSDDEFFLPDVLNNMKKFLDDNLDFISVGGGCARFVYKWKYLDLKLMYSNMQLKELENSEVRIRLMQHFQHYLARTIYGVNRTSAWLNALSAMNYESSMPDTGLEIIFELMIVVQGKVKIMPEIHWLRSVENPPVDQVLSNHEHFHNWWKYSSTSTEREIFFKAISENIDSRVHQGLNFRELVFQAVETYCLTAVLRKTSLNRSIKHRVRKWASIKLRPIFNAKLFLKIVIVSLFQVNNNLQKFNSEIRAENYNKINLDIYEIQKFLSLSGQSSILKQRFKLY